VVSSGKVPHPRRLGRLLVANYCQTQQITPPRPGQGWLSSSTRTPLHSVVHVSNTALTEEPEPLTFSPYDFSISRLLGGTLNSS
jgi:hypothetical protein